MSVPTDPPYCLVYSTSYMKGVKLDHFDTHNNPVGTFMCHCICHTTLQFMNTYPNLYKQYLGGQLILPHGAQYHEWLFPAILKPRNHHKPLTDSAGKPYLVETVGDFWASDPIFKGSYGNSLLYTLDELCKLEDQGIYLPAYHAEIPVPPAPLYHQARVPEATRLPPLKVSASDVPEESKKTTHTSRKDGTHSSSGHSSTTSRC